MTFKIPENCRTCRFSFVASAGSVFQNRPTEEELDSGLISRVCRRRCKAALGYYPEVKDDEWCGEWEERP